MAEAGEKFLIIYGRNSIDEALLEGLVLNEIMVEQGKEEKFENLIRRIREKGIKLSFLPVKTIDKISGTFKHQGIIAEITTPPNVIESGVTPEDWKTYQAILALDGITDTGNLGAILRSALLFGFEAVILPNDNSARITPQTIRSSAGALYKTKILYINSLNTFIEEAKSEEFTVYGLAGESPASITGVDFPEKVCLVVGSEREGLRKSVKKNCDFLVNIPTTGKINSLNVSVAAAISMWEIFKRKG